LIIFSRKTHQDVQKTRRDGNQDTNSRFKEQRNFSVI